MVLTTVKIKKCRRCGLCMGGKYFAQPDKAGYCHLCRQDIKKRNSLNETVTFLEK